MRGEARDSLATQKYSSQLRRATDAVWALTFKCQALAHQRLRELRRDEWPQVVDAFADPDESERNRALLRDGGHDAAFGAAIELGQHETGQPERLVEGAHL